MPTKPRASTKSAKTKKAKPTARKAPRKRSKARAEKAISHEDIQTAAYHIYKHRIGNGYLGDQASDWYEAKRMLN